MTTPITVEMMSENALWWRCLHGGPLTTDSLERWDREGDLPWAEFRARNLPLLRNLVETYGACGVAARVGDHLVGQLRFYPRAVCELAEGGLGMCLQQQSPHGPPNDLGHRRFPPLAEIKDKTLVVHCMMLASAGPDGESHRRKGTGTRMARALIDWATANGWQAIEATAYESLPIVYAITGQADRSFWEKLGYRLVRTEREPALEEEADFVGQMRAEARSRGLDPATVANRYVMRLALG
jgi:GNAT superfamily N-acetyltransferase